ncbi:MAG TPA: alpha/beta hydrolase [Thermoleophilaceae bacterium]|jgi:alpha-beta hydrolase superfamily lysophospholipase
MATHEEGRFGGEGGVEIYWQAWLPEGEPRAVVVLAHGASEHGGRYAWTGEQLAGRGYALYAIDHRGHGRSAGDRAVIDRMRNAVEDLHTLVERAQGAHPGRPLVLLGHSMGGAVALAYTAEHEDALDALMLSGALAVLEAASPVQRVAGRVLSAVAPSLGVVAIDSSAVSRDPEVVADYDADPLNHHGKLPARTVAELSRAIDGFPEAVTRFRLPMLVMHGTADRLVPIAGSEMVVDRTGSEDKTFKRYEDLFHEILNEPERQQVLDDIADWLDARFPA